MRSKYSREVLAQAVERNRSFAGVLRDLGLKIAGGSQRHLKALTVDYGIDTSHFLGQAHLRGGCPKGGFPKLQPSALLVKDRRRFGRRERAARLRRAMIESGVPVICSVCGCGEYWNGAPLRLQIDHRSPNCHSQTENFGTRNRRG